jgi:hypothetical protein
VVAYGFRPQFVDPIRAGLGILPVCGGQPAEFVVNKAGGLSSFDPTRDLDPPIYPKRQTIRAERKRHARSGEELQLYCGMRTKHCFLIGNARCTDVAAIDIHFGRHQDWLCTPVHGILEGADELDRFARSDGFPAWIGLRNFWRIHHPGVDDFTGVIIFWEPQT